MERIKCDYCGRVLYRVPSKVKKHNFCSRKCMADFSSREKNPEGYKTLKDFTNISKHCTEMNHDLNPTRMTAETREKVRRAKLNSGEGKTYTKLYGRHEHRIVAERMLGRPLKKGEVVHHKDGNKRNNAPEDLMVFPSQAEHAKFHARGGDAE